MRVVSLCDLTGHMVLPWAEAGYECLVFDIQHPAGASSHPLHRNIKRVGCDLFEKIGYLSAVKIAFAFPPCTDLTGSGARWWKSKGEAAYVRAMQLVTRCRDLVDATSAPWMLENPPGRINSGAGFDSPHPARWEKKWDHIFQPFEYGGYDGFGKEFWDHGVAGVPGSELWQKFSDLHKSDSFMVTRLFTAFLEDLYGFKISEQSDGYHKKTCLWTGNGFRMPEPRPIPLHARADRIHKCPPGPERANIRSATPMGFARAVFEANK